MFVAGALKDKIKQVYEEERVVIIEVGGKSVAGVYADTGGNADSMEE